MFGLSSIRLYAYAVIAIVIGSMIGYLIYQYHTGQEAKAELATVKQSLIDEIAAHNAYIAIRAAQDKITTQTSTDYENAITDLVGQLNTARDTIPTVRVCHNMPSSSPTSAATSRPDAAVQDRPSATDDGVVEEISTDEPYKIAGEAAECGIRLNKLQDWVSQQIALQSPPSK